MSTQPETFFSMFTAGDSDWISEVSIQLAKIIEERLPYGGENLPEPMRVSKDIFVSAVISFVMVGFTIYVANRLGTKALDDIYNQFIQPRFKKFLSEADRKLKGGNRKVKKVLTVNRWYAEGNVLVCVSVVGRNLREVVNQLDLVPLVHISALGWIASNGRLKLVHHYRIEGGKVNATPFLFDRIQEILSKEQTEA
jgi:hypothetical protein